MQTQYCFVGLIERECAIGDGTDLVVSVTFTVLAEVEVKVALRIEAVTYEAVSSGRADASMQDGPMQTEFGYQSVGPCVVAHLPFGTVADIMAVVAEVFGHGGLAFV